MANEELTQRKYLVDGYLKGEKFGDFELLNIGGTHASELVKVGIDAIIPASVGFPFTEYSPPKRPGSVRPDRVYLRRQGTRLIPVAVGEDKAPTKLSGERAVTRAAEQGLFAAAVLSAPWAVTSDGIICRYIDVHESLATGAIVYNDDGRDFGPGVLANLLAGDTSVAKDPKPLAESVWQMIWQATKEEPKSCLLTFVEIFMLKFLSDNLPVKDLPESYRFYALNVDKQQFQNTNGITAIEYYVQKIRPFIKGLFRDNVIAKDPAIADIFGLQTIVSKTSVINGFAFLKSSATSLATFNRVFVEILEAFQKFGPLTTIDPEFKLRLYETFLRRSARQQKLGQFFTPRSVVRPMIKMARLDTLAAGAIVLDPAAGVGGFMLEPPLVVPGLAGNTRWTKGLPERRLKFVGVDVDANTHILAKANTLLHHAEAVRDPAITVDGLNQLMAETFVLMNRNETLGSLENPPRESADIILTNPPYVTRGSGVYKDEVKELGTGENGVDLRDHYERSGLGVEALFVRYIVEALKAEGRAFVIVPLGLLNRTDPKPKERILNKCNLLAAIALPRNTFFNTAQLTYILVLEKRRTQKEARPDVFCGIARTIGETLDWERIPTPLDNDLDALAGMFVAWTKGDTTATDGSLIAKVRSASEFTENDRWDVSRFWTEDEQVKLGLQEGAVGRVDFIDEATLELEEIVQELKNAKAELQALTSASTVTLSLDDATKFDVQSGSRITGKHLRENPGKLIVYSCFKDAKEQKGQVSARFWRRSVGGTIETGDFVSVNANGASVGHVYARRGPCAITDDVISIRAKVHKIDNDYLAVALRTAVNAGGFLYEAKLFVKRVKELAIDVPVDTDGEFDVLQQQAIANAVKRFDALRTRLADLGIRTAEIRAV